MKLAAQIIFWLSASALFYAYAGYPVLLYWSAPCGREECDAASSKPQSLLSSRLTTKSGLSRESSKTLWRLIIRAHFWK